MKRTIKTIDAIRIALCAKGWKSPEIEWVLSQTNDLQQALQYSRERALRVNLEQLMPFDLPKNFLRCKEEEYFPDWDNHRKLGYWQWDPDELTLERPTEDQTIESFLENPPDVRLMNACLADWLNNFRIPRGVQILIPEEWKTPTETGEVPMIYFLGSRFRHRCADWVACM